MDSPSESYLGAVAFREYVTPYLAKWHEAGIGPDRDSVLSAAAVGLVEFVWRNSPIEDAHARGRVNQGEMMAESVALYKIARRCQTDEGVGGLFTFEDHLLHMNRTWTGTDKTVRQMGYGVLGEWRKHIRKQCRLLRWIGFDAGPDALDAVLINEAPWPHFGMPTWKARVEMMIALLRDPDDAFWLRFGYTYQRVVAEAPDGMLDDLDHLRRSLISDPSAVDPAVLWWLVSYGGIGFLNVPPTTRVRFRLGKLLFTPQQLEEGAARLRKQL